MEIILKICSKCKKEYPNNKEYFYKRSDAKDGLKHQCINCCKEYTIKYREENREKMRECKKKWYEKNKEKEIERQKKYKKENPKKWKNTHLKRTFGITMKEYNQILEEQNRKCRICGIHQSKLKTSLCVDHNHKTGKISGLLCNNCNMMLGFIEKYKKNPNKWDNYLKNINIKTRVLQKIIKNLENSLDYYNETKDEFDLVSDIQELITDLCYGILE